MLSSTSNSESAILSRPWIRIWLVALILMVGLVGLIESMLRAKGHVPSVVDDKTLWAMQRRQVDARDARMPMVLIGTSRIQLGFVPSILEEAFPRTRVIQLAVEGRWPLAVLKDLASDETFSGVVLCDINAVGFILDAEASQQPYVDGYHALYRNLAWPLIVLNKRMGVTLQGHFVVMSPSVNPPQILGSLFTTGALPPRSYVITRADRSRSADYSLIDVAKQRQMRIDRLNEVYAATPSPDPDAWLAKALVVEPWVQAIQDRGGRVVFVWYVTSEEMRDLDEKAYPRQSYWDRFAATTTGTAIHFADVPGLRDYECPDASHLDARDVGRFTLALGEELERRGVLSEGGGGGEGNQPRMDTD